MSRLISGPKQSPADTWFPHRWGNVSMKNLGRINKYNLSFQNKQCWNCRARLPPFHWLLLLFLFCPSFVDVDCRASSNRSWRHPFICYFNYWRRACATYYVFLTERPRAVFLSQNVELLRGDESRFLSFSPQNNRVLCLILFQEFETKCRIEIQKKTHKVGSVREKVSQPTIDNESRNEIVLCDETRKDAAVRFTCTDHNGQQLVSNACRERIQWEIIFADIGSLAYERGRIRSNTFCILCCAGNNCK